MSAEWPLLIDNLLAIHLPTVHLPLPSMVARTVHHFQLTYFSWREENAWDSRLRDSGRKPELAIPEKFYKKFCYLLRNYGHASGRVCYAVPTGYNSMKCTVYIKNTRSPSKVHISTVHLDSTDVRSQTLEQLSHLFGSLEPNSKHNFDNLSKVPKMHTTSTHLEVPSKLYS